MGLLAGCDLFMMSSLFKMYISSNVHSIFNVRNGSICLDGKNGPAERWVGKEGTSLCGNHGSSFFFWMYPQRFPFCHVQPALINGHQVAPLL